MTRAGKPGKPRQRPRTDLFRQAIIMHRAPHLLGLGIGITLTAAWLGLGVGPAPETAAAPAPEAGPLPVAAYHFQGAGSCSAAACHNDMGPRGARGSEYTTWVIHDRHARAWSVLF